MNTQNKYRPQPIETAQVQLTPELERLSEELARNVHEVWAQQRMTEGWTYGPRRDDERKEHPCLQPYEHLPELEKEYDRSIVTQTIKAIIALDFRVKKSQS